MIIIIILAVLVQPKEAGARMWQLSLNPAEQR